MCRETFPVFCDQSFQVNDVYDKHNIIIMTSLNVEVFYETSCFNSLTACTNYAQHDHQSLLWLWYINKWQVDKRVMNYYSFIKYIVATFNNSQSKPCKEFTNQGKIILFSFQNGFLSSICFFFSKGEQDHFIEKSVKCEWTLPLF